MISQRSQVSTEVGRLISGFSVLKDIKKLNCSPLRCPGLNSAASATTVGQFSIFRLSRVDGGQRNAEKFQDFTKIKRCPHQSLQQHILRTKSVFVLGAI